MGQTVAKRPRTQSFGSAKDYASSGQMSCPVSRSHNTSLKHKDKTRRRRRSGSLTLDDPNKVGLSASQPAVAFDPEIGDSVFIEEEEGSSADMGSDEEGYDDNVVILTDTDKAWIRQAMIAVKASREIIGYRGIQKMFERMPHVCKRFSQSQNRPIRFGQAWELMGQGMTFFTALECCAQRISHIFAMRAYLARLTKIHVSYGIKLEDMLKSLEAFHDVIAAHLASRQHPPDKAGTAAIESFFLLIGQVLAQAYDTTTISDIDLAMQE